MAAGSNRRLIWNTREQVLSTDLNRAEAFGAADLSEIMRALHVQVNQPACFEDSDLGLEFSGREDHSVTETPLYGVVLSGLLVRPTNASMSLVVDPGVAMVVDPDASPSQDDSPYKLVRDPGANLTVLQNTSGSTRVDVVECSRVDLITEIDSRNQYNTATGLFTPVSFNKVGQGQFQYRIRQGTPGAGVPSAVQGWMPLCVISIPTATTSSLDLSAFFDVRALVSARARNSSNKRNYGYGHFQWCRGAASFISGNLYFAGQAEVIDDWGYKLGGQLQNTGGTNSPTMPETGLVELSANTNWETGFTTAPNAFFYLYLAVPVTQNVALTPYVPLLGPRWVRYMRQSSEFIPPSQVYQQPAEPAGIPVLSRTAPNEKGTALLSAPPVLGLSCQMKGYCIAMGWMDSGSTMRPFIMDGRRCTFMATYAATSEPSLTFANFSNVVIANTSANVANFNLQPDRDFPRNAKRIYGNAVIKNFSNNGGSSGYFYFSSRIALQSNISQYETLGLHSMFMANAISLVPQHYIPVSIPVENQWSTHDSTRVFSIAGESNIGPVYLFANSTAAVTVTGFEF